jgi:hypothetical protein
MDRPCSCGRLLHGTTRYAPGFISQPASLPHKGQVLVPHIRLSSSRTLKKNHNTAITKLATQENSQGYNKPRLITATLDSFPVLSFGCLSGNVIGLCRRKKFTERI